MDEVVVDATLDDDDFATATCAQKCVTANDKEPSEGLKPLPFSKEDKFIIVNLYAIALAIQYGKDKLHRGWIETMLKTAIGHFNLDATVYMALVETVSSYSNCDSMDDVHDVLQGLVRSLKTGEDGETRNLIDVIKAAITFSISTGCYDARSRCTMKLMTQFVNVPWEDVETFELTLVSVLEGLLQEEQLKDGAQKALDRKRKLKRAMIIALATVGGGAALALSAGLAAPLIGAGAVAVLGSGSAAIFTGTTGITLITSIFGAAGAGLTGIKMNRRVGSLDQFEFGLIGEKRKDLHVMIAISGFLTEKENLFSSSWKGLALSREQYCLCWESRFLRQFGASLTSFIKDQAVNMAVKEALKRTILSGIMSAISWPLALIQAGYVIDNPWNVCTQRSKEAGLELARVLLEKHQGARPTSLIGYSHGARVVFFCLEELAKRKGSIGIIEDVYLLGAPVGVTSSVWDSFDDVVAGRIVNCYSKSDWLLKFVYRTASIEVGDVAGLAPVEGVNLDRLINVDVSDIISGHMDYGEPKKIYDIMTRIGAPTREFEGCHDDDASGAGGAFASVIDTTDAFRETVRRLSSFRIKADAVTAICDRKQPATDADDSKPANGNVK